MFHFDNLFSAYSVTFCAMDTDVCLSVVWQ